MDVQSIKQLYLLSLDNMNQAKTSWHEQTSSINAYVLKQMQQRAKQGYFNCVIDLAEAGQAANNTPFKNGKQGVKLAIQRLSWQYALVSWLAK